MSESLTLSWACRNSRRNLDCRCAASALVARKTSTTRLTTSCARDGSGAEYATSTMSVRIRDRKSTRLNSSHVKISYAVFCLKKKKKKKLFSLITKKTKNRIKNII